MKDFSSRPMLLNLGTYDPKPFPRMRNLLIEQALRNQQAWHRVAYQRTVTVMMMGCYAGGVTIGDGDADVDVMGIVMVHVMVMVMAATVRVMVTRTSKNHELMMR